jgi:hypothetical protein
MDTVRHTRPSSSARPGPVRWRLLAVTAMAWAALASILFGWSGRFSLAAVERACGAPAPDVRTAPSASDVHAFLAACGPEGLAAYRDLQVVDVLYPAVNAALLVLVLGLLIGRLRVSLTWLAVLPVMAAVGDYLENAAAWTMLGRGQEHTSWADLLFPVGSAVKVGATWAAWLTVSVLLAWLLVRWARGRSAAGRRPSVATVHDAAPAPARPLQRTDRVSSHR